MTTTTTQQQKNKLVVNNKKEGIFFRMGLSINAHNDPEETHSCIRRNERNLYRIACLQNSSMSIVRGLIKTATQHPFSIGPYYQAWSQNYKRDFVKKGSFAPIMHLMVGTFIAGVCIENKAHYARHPPGAHGDHH